MDDTKTELFKYLAEQTIAIQDEGEELLSTSDCSVLTNSNENTACISPCSHEEADTSLLLHAFDSVKEVCRKVMLRTIDTDVVMLAVSFLVEWTWRSSGLLLVLGRHSAALLSMRLMQFLDKGSAKFFRFFSRVHW